MDEKVFRTHARLQKCPPALVVYILYRRLVEQGPRATWLWLTDKVKRRLLGFSPPEIGRVAPHLYIGGQHKRHGLDAMRREGIRAIVNMREEADDAKRGLLLDDYLWLPTTDDHPPTMEDLERGVDFIEAHTERGEGVYVHCASGVGRAPTMAAAYLVRQGATPDEAWTTITSGRPFVRPTPTQIDVIRRFADLGRAIERRSHMRISSEAAPESDLPARAQGSLQSPTGDQDRRVEAAYERISSDPNLTGGLTDEAAVLLLQWAQDQVQDIVAPTAGQEETAAWARITPQLHDLRRTMRKMAQQAADSRDPISKLQELIQSH